MVNVLQWDPICYHVLFAYFLVQYYRLLKVDFESNFTDDLDKHI